MQIVEPYAKMMPIPWTNSITERSVIGFTEANGLALLRHVEWCSRISHRSEEAVTNDSWRRLLEAVVMGHGDWSVTEHVVVSVDAVVDRGITHEWVRHRIAAYTQESTRFVNYAKKATTTNEYVNPAKFICPPSILATKEDHDADEDGIYHRWVAGRQADELEYMYYIKNGIKPQEARTCFPNALAARLVATYNLRMWRLFFLMRTTKEAHPQMRQVTIPLLEEFKKNIPLLYDDIEPNVRQVDNLKKAR